MPAVSWPQERIESLRELHKTDLPYSKIGPLLGVTANAVAGMAKRLNLPARAPRGYSGPRTWKPRMTTKTHPEPSVAQCEAIEPQPLLKSVFDIGKNECRYYVGEVGDSASGFCAHPTDEKQSWCRFHQGVVFMKRGGAKFVFRSRVA